MRQLISLYGPFAIQSFGLFIVLGIIIFTILFLRDPRRKKLISIEQYYNGLSGAIIAGFIGGRLLYMSTNWETFGSLWNIFAFWQGGYSLLGGILALMIFVPWYLKKQEIPILPLVDLVSLYAPFLQAISRMGCFFAGCCYGIHTTSWWGIAHDMCPGELLHPTQLYSAVFLFGIFLFLYLFAQYHFKKAGQLFCVYLILMSIERFIIDFWRADREFISLISILSLAQLLALLLLVLGICGLIYFTFSTTAKKT